MTGAFAKALSLAVQIVAVAVAVRVLNTDGFAMFVTIASLVTWISLASLGVGPGLTLGIARLSATEDRSGEARLFAVSLILMVCITVGILLVALFVERAGVIDQLLRSWGGADGLDAGAAIGTLTLLVAAQLVLSVPEAALLGYQAQYRTNLSIAVGSAAALVLLLAVGSSIRSVAEFVLVSQGPQVAARVLNGLSLVRSRPYLLRPDAIPIRSLVRPVLGSGVAFGGIQLASYVSLQLGVLVLAVTTNAASVSLGGVILRGITMAAGFVTLVTTPTWPALANAVARGDRTWARRMYWRMPTAGLLYASAVAAVVLVGSEWLLDVWTGRHFALDLPLRLCLALYFIAGVWSHVFAITLIGLGAIRFTAVVLLIEAAVIAGLEVVLIPSLGVTGYLGALLVGTTFVSSWILPLRARAEISAIGQP
jgi:O-antigen/teichoic acid export membrane protein